MKAQNTIDNSHNVAVSHTTLGRVMSNDTSILYHTNSPHKPKHRSPIQDTFSYSRTYDTPYQSQLKHMACRHMGQKHSTNTGFTISIFFFLYQVIHSIISRNNLCHTDLLYNTQYWAAIASNTYCAWYVYLYQHLTP